MGTIAEHYPSQDQESVWTQLLRASRRGDQTDVCWRVVALGSATDSRRALVRELQRVPNSSGNQTKSEDVTDWSLAADEEPAGAPMPLEFTSWKAQTPEADVSDNVNLWAIAEQDQAILLRTAIPSAESLSQSVVLLIVDLASPHEALREAQAWAKAVKAHADTLLTGKPELREKIEEHAQRCWLEYDSKVGTVGTPLPQWGSEANPAVASSVATAAAKVDDKEAADMSMSSMVASLEEGVMVNFVGAATVVVGVNSETYLAKSSDEKEQDFVQYQLRRMAMRLGAAAVYVSSKSGTNMTLLNDYLIHLRHPRDFPLLHKPQFVHRDQLFIPCGWDRGGLVDSLVSDTIKSLTVDQFFAQGDTSLGASIHEMPGKATGGASLANEVVPMEDQKFLERLLAKQKLMGDIGTGKRTTERGVLEDAGSGGGLSKAADARGSSSGDAASTSSSGGADASGTQEKESAMIASFFHSLLARDKPGATGTGTGAGTDATPSVTDSSGSTGADAPH